MLHQRRKRKFSRRIAHRMSMLKNLSKSLIEHERIKTTLPKAKSLRSVVEKLVTIGKENTLHAKRQLISKLGGDYKEVNKLLNTISPKFVDRKGGYTRIIKSGFRLGDHAPMAYIEFVEGSKKIPSPVKTTA
jgi:large subunit ribosomal protein L17